MSANLLSYMLGETESGNVAYTEFMLTYTANPKKLYCFMEGNDDIFYYDFRLREGLPSMEIFSFPCYGKEEVLKVYHLIKRNTHFDQTKTAFFLDKDFDSSTANADIYETPCHSVENFYADSIVVKRIMNDAFKMRYNATDLSKCMEVYDNLHSEVLKLAQPVNSWISCYTDKRHTNSLTTRVNIQDKTAKLFTKVISSDLTSVTLRNEITSYDNLQKYFNNYDISRVEYQNKLDLFAIGSPSVNSRGKFELQFLWNFLNKMKEKLQDKTNMICSRTYKSVLSLRLDALLLELTSFAITPVCLKQYIQKFAPVM